MVTENLFPNTDSKLTKKRNISVFERAEVSVPKATEDTVAEVYDKFKTLIKDQEEALVILDAACDRLFIPIPPEEAEVRAAHRRLFDDDSGKISFGQFKDVIDEMSKKSSDMMFQDFKGYGQGDAILAAKGATKRSFSKAGCKDEPFLDSLLKYGGASMLLWGLNELVGAYHAKDHATVTVAKFPPGTEAAGVLQQIVTGMVMLKFLQGVTDDALEDLSKLDDINFGTDFKGALAQAKAAPPPQSTSYKAFKATLSSADTNTVANYSLGHIAGNIGTGFESWWAYMTTRNNHEAALRTYHAGAPFRTGDVSPTDEHVNLMNREYEFRAGDLLLMSNTLRARKDPGETCCFLRFLDAVDIDVLGMIRSIIDMALAMLRAQVSQSLSWYLRLAKHPWSVISEEILRTLDAVFEKVVDKILDAVDIDSDLWEIVEACTPVKEMYMAIISMIEFIRDWYHDLIKKLGKEYMDEAKNLTDGWESIVGIRSAQEMLKSIDKMIQEKQQQVSSGPISDNRLNALISDLEAFSYSVDFGAGAEAMESVGGLTQQVVDWCRTLGDWDKLKKAFL